MAQALRALKQIAISNPENTVGTAEAAVELLYGTMSVAYGDNTIHYPDQERANLSRHMGDDFIVGKLVEGTMEGELNARHAAWLFSNAIRGNITPTQPDNINEPNTYSWVWEPGLTTANTPDIANGIDTFTLEFGDNEQAYEAEYVFTRTLTITGAPNEPVTFTWDWAGRQLTETTFTSLSAVNITSPSLYFPSNLSKFYIDTSYAGIGGTQKTDTLRAFTWTFETGFTARFAADGNQYFAAISEDKKRVQLDLTYYLNSTSETERALYNSRGTTYLRVELSGPTEMDSAQSNPPRVYLDGAFRYTEWPEHDDEDGALVTTVSAESVYDVTASKQFGATLLTTLAAYP